MYTKMFPYKDVNDKPRNERAHFNLTEREVFKLLPEFQTMFSWKDSLAAEGEARELATEEVVNFYNALEEILLSAYGVPSDDGRHFRKAGRYDFEESFLFNACMIEFVTNPKEANKFIEDLMPKGMEEMIRNTDANYAEAAKNAKSDDERREIERLRAQLAEFEQGKQPSTSS